MDEWFPVHDEIAYHCPDWYEDEDDDPGLGCCPSCGRLTATGEICPECRAYEAQYDALVVWKADWTGGEAEQ